MWIFGEKKVVVGRDIYSGLDNTSTLISIVLLFFSFFSRVYIQKFSMILKFRSVGLNNGLKRSLVAYPLGHPTLLRKRPWHRSFPENFSKFSKHLFYRLILGILQNISRKQCLYDWSHSNMDVEYFIWFCLSVYRHLEITTIEVQLIVLLSRITYFSTGDYHTFIMEYFCENSERVEAGNYFLLKAHCRCLTGS